MEMETGKEIEMEMELETETEVHLASWQCIEETNCYIHVTGLQWP